VHVRKQDLGFQRHIPLFPLFMFRELVKVRDVRFVDIGGMDLLTSLFKLPILDVTCAQLFADI